jgi:hypothetical protein
VLGSSYPKAIKGHLKTVDLLLENGTDVNAKGQSFGTALQAAVMWNKVDVAVDLMRLLLGFGADINRNGGDAGSQAAAIKTSVGVPCDSHRLSCRLQYQPGRLQ